MINKEDASPRKRHHLLQGGSRSPLTMTAAALASLTNEVAPSSLAKLGGNALIDSAPDNPLLRPWSDQPFNLPPFGDIREEHFVPAFEVAMKAHLADLEAIASAPVAADGSCPSVGGDPFDSVLGAYDRAGALLSRIEAVYENYTDSLNTPKMQEVETAMSPVLSRHASASYDVPGLFEKVASMFEIREEMLRSGQWSAEQARLAERVHIDFVKMGAKFDAATKREYANIQAELASLQTKFSQNVLKDEEEWELVLTQGDMAGCPPEVISAARQAAADRGKGPDDHVVTLGRSAVEPFLTYSPRRDLRRIVFEAFTRRGELSPERDNLKIAVDILRLRRRQAKLHGKGSFSELKFEDTMAGTPENGMKLLADVWAKAKDAADREREMMEEFLSREGEVLEGGIQPWDWRYYAERVRRANYDFDESELKPYLSLDAVTAAVFDVSNKLYGLKYVRRDDIAGYHPDVVVYEVRGPAGGADGGGEGDELVAIFLHDNYARRHKSGGAWMSELRTQTRNLAPGSNPIESVPIVCNNNNFSRGNDSTLLSFDDGVTLFHEMGHGHHGMLSKCFYEYLASTNVLKDFVELPSQLMEHWLSEPSVLRKHAKHYMTGETVSDHLIKRFKAAELFNEGFATVEYTACAMLDIALHSLAEYGDDFDLAQFERDYLAASGMPQGIVMRHRPAHFNHLFASSSYAAGYYVYQWAQVLDNDVFAAFEETGNVFDACTAERCRRWIYSAGNTMPPQELFRKFRGRDPDPKFMLKNLGLIPK